MPTIDLSQAQAWLNRFSDAVTQNSSTELFTAGAFVLLMALYVLPSIMAGTRNHHNKVAIFLLNVLLGWTVLGWIVSLVWSMTNPPKVMVYRQPNACPAHDIMRFTNALMDIEAEAQIKEMPHEREKA